MISNMEIFEVLEHPIWIKNSKNKVLFINQRVPFWGAKVANQVKISIKITCEITLRFTCDFFY